MKRVLPAAVFALALLCGSPRTLLAEEPAAQPAPAAATSTAVDTALAGEYGDYEETAAETELAEGAVADPLEPFNRVMFAVNDKLYDWVLRPAARGYAKVLPKPARRGVGNLFSNVAFPVRFVNCVLQRNLRGAAVEVGRFTANTVFGVAGLMDVASRAEIALRRREEDLGQTLGTYGIGPGFFVVWPVLGPSTLRDTVGTVGDSFLHPISYLDSENAALGLRALDKVNDLSLNPGVYESLKETALDPYAAMRDAYVRYRRQKIRTR